jgi:uncharacterized protein (DUF488 family)
MSADLHQTVFTIGHSNLELSKFVALLGQHGIQAVADVRSSPYSHYNPQFNREPLDLSLRKQGVRYVFLGAELGARRSEAGCYVNAHADYALIARSPAFKRGLERIIQGAGKRRIALMCAEKDPLDCHRGILIAPQLRECGVSVVHILLDGTLEPHEQTERRLLELFKLPERELFRSTEEIIAVAYKAREEKIAYEDDALVLREQSRRYGD